MANDIYLYGDIFPEDWSEAGDYGIISLSTVRDKLNEIQADEVNVHIRSGGGSVMEGFAIYDFLRSSGKKITTIGEGIVGSIATVVFLAGDERKLTENCEFFIHMPWALAMGTADDLEEMVEDLRDAENKIIDFYVARTGADNSILRDYMDNETTLTAEQAKSMGFATEVIKTVSAKLMPNRIAALINKSNMSKLTDTLKDLKDKIFNSGVKPAEDESKQGEINNLTLTLADGEQQIIVDCQGTDPNVGDAVKNADGSVLKDGDYLLPTGETYVVNSGNIAEIKAKEEEENPELVNLKAENENLKQELANLKAENEVVAKEVNEITAMVNEFVATNETLKQELAETKKLINSDYQPPKPEARMRPEEETEMTEIEKIMARRKEREEKQNKK